MNLKITLPLLLLGMSIISACQKEAALIPHISSSAQSNNTNETPDIYTAGYIKAASGNLLATYWKNGAETVLGDSTSNSVGYAIAVNNGDVYVAGYTRTQTGNMIAAYWKNGTLTKLGDGSTPTSALGIFVDGPDVYIAGTLGDLPSTAVYWKNGTMTTLADASSISEANAISVKGNDVYVTGFSNNNYATCWKNGTATILDNTVISDAADITSDGNDIYVAGYAGNNGGAMYWKNGVAVPLADDGSSLTANNVVVSGNNVYVCGNMTGQYGVYWKNGIINRLPLSTIADDIAVDGNDIYLAGSATDPETGVADAVYWKNGQAVKLAENGEAHSIALVAN